MTNELVERVADVISMVFEGADITETAKGVIAIALEEAAQFVQDECHDYDDAHRIAAAIRAMIKEKNDE